MVDQVSLDDIKSIIELIKQTEDVAEFSLKFGDVEISLSRESAAGLNRPVVGNVRPVEQPAEIATPKSVDTGVKAPAGAAVAALQPDEIAITAPMVGTFYRCPQPGEPPFVEIGATVDKHSTVCIIEVMKLMNSLPAGVEGVVTRILVEDSQPVEYGQPLMYIRKAA